MIGIQNKSKKYKTKQENCFPDIDMSSLIPNNSIKIVQLCTANASRDEKQPNYRYGMRHDTYVNFIQKLDKKESVDFISVKELRQCQNKDKTKSMSPHDIVKDYCAETSLTHTPLYPVKLHPTIDKTKPEKKNI
jgi:hypothetical protein